MDRKASRHPMAHARVANLERHRWPKRHAYVVEQCRVVNVRDVLSPIDTEERATLLSSPRVRDLILIATDTGPIRRWWFRCPTCARLRESLFVPPNVVEDDWRCRACWQLVYASQRYGPRHPLRRVLTSRKRLSQQRRVERERRRYRRAEERAAHQAAAAQDKQRHEEEAVTTTAKALQDAMREQIRRELEFDAPLNQEYLDAIERGEFSPRRLEARVARTLGR